MNLGLEGACALGAGESRGIGYAICENLAREGCDVALFARNQAEIEASIAARSRRRNDRIRVPLAVRDQVIKDLPARVDGGALGSGVANLTHSGKLGNDTSHKMLGDWTIPSGRR